MTIKWDNTRYNACSEMEVVLSRIANKYSFFATLLFTLTRLRFCSGPGAEVPTAATTGSVIIFNEDFMKSLKPDDAVFVAIHEVGHIILGHMDDFTVCVETGFGPDGEVFDPKCANVAADYVLNALLVSAGMPAPASALLDVASFPADMVWQEAYKILKQGSKQGNMPKQGAEKGQGDHSEWRKPMDGMPDEEQQQSKAPSATKVQRALKNAELSAAGKLPASLRRLVDSACEPQVTWTDQVPMLMQAARGRGDRTWARPQRRRLVLPPHIYTPARTGTHAGCVVVYGDTSGSIDDAVWKHFFGEMAGILEQLNPEECYIGCCDTVATEPYPVEAVDDIASWSPTGGGGTDMPAIFKKLEEEGIEPEVCIVLTDGYTPWGEVPGYPVIWVMTTDVIAPYGSSLRIQV